MRSIEIAKVRLDGGTQPRAALNRELVDEYAEKMKAGDIFPPVIVFYDGSMYWLADGFHRVNAARLAGRAMVEADQRMGTKRDAILFACGANSSHGERRSNLDKRRAVETLLRDEEWVKWSDNEIARRCCVGRTLVAETRAAILPKRHDAPPPPPRTVQRNGTTYTQNTAAIGKTAKTPAAAPGKLRDRPIWTCEECLQDFDRKLKHCKTCAHHYPIEDGRCSNCHESLRGSPGTFKTGLVVGDLYPPATTDPLPIVTAAEIKTIQTTQADEGETKFNRTNDNVEWALWTWNPVTGCLHNCDYCYARDIANRFYPEKFEPTFRPGRLKAPRNTKRPDDALVALPFDPKTCKGGIGEKNVFTCSMADLFGKWVPQEWIDAVFSEVRDNPQWNFLFLTKFPQRLSEIEWPTNAWCGTTVDSQARVEAAERAFRKVKAGVRWLSVEPMQERLTFSSLKMFDWIVIGGRSASTGAPAFQPEWEWVEHLVAQARAANCKVYFKPNLTVRPREYPAT